MEFSSSTGLGIALGFLLLFYHLFRTRREKRPTPPGNMGIGESLDLLWCWRADRLTDFIKKRNKKYGDVFKTSVFGMPAVVFTSSEGNRFVFNNDNKALSNYTPPGIQNLLGYGSLFSKSGQEAKFIRKIFMTFSLPEGLQKFVGRADSIINDHIRGHWIGHQELQAYPLINRLYLSVAASLFMTLTDESVEKQLSPLFHNILRGFVHVPLDVPGTVYHRAKQSSNRLHKLLQKLIDQRRRDLENGTAPEDLLTHLLCARDDRGNGLTEQEVTDNILGALAGAQETSVITTTFIMKFLALNPHCYNKILEEQMEIVRRMTENQQQELQWDDISQGMKYSWAAVQETLRIQPPVTAAFRKSVEDSSYGGYVIPKGWKIVWTATTHSSAECFRDPEIFDPSRFEGQRVSPYMFVPFGGGQRRCPGDLFARMVILVFLRNIVKNFQWDLVDVNEKYIGDLLPLPADGLRIKLRQHAQVDQF